MILEVFCMDLFLYRGQYIYIYFLNSASHDLLKIHQDSCWHMTRMLEAHSQGPGPVPFPLVAQILSWHCEKNTHVERQLSKQ